MASTHRLISFDDAQGQFATLELFQAEPVRPVVILCGWTGSAMRMMKGYSAWYRAQNYHVVTLPTRFHFGLTSSVYSLERLRREMDPLLDALLEHTPYIFDPQSSEKLIIQVWSNGGSHTLCHILDNLEERSKKSGKEVKFRNPVLLTMDSAPNLPTPNQPMTGASLSWGAIRGYGRFINPSVMGKQTAFNEFVSTCIACVLLPAYIFSKPILRLLAPKYVGEFSAEVRKALTHKDLDSARRLFLFGDGDRMVPAPGIRIFRAEEEKRLGADRIDSCEFDGSDHVQHGLVHPEAYWEKVTEVLLKCGVDVPNPNAGRKLAKAKL